LKTILDSESSLLGQLIKLGQLLIHEGVVSVDELGHRPVAGEQVAEKQTRLSLHRRRKIFRIVGAVGLARRRHTAQVAKVQPAVEEAIHEAGEACVSDHALHLLLQLGILGEFAGLGAGEQRVIWRSSPQCKRKPRGDVVGLERFGRLVGDLAEVKEVR